MSHSYFGHSLASNVLSNVGCQSSGNQHSLLECSYNATDAVINCGDGAAAGIVCIGNKTYYYKMSQFNIY